MSKKGMFFLMSLSCLSLCLSSSYAQNTESITISTYYPSPYGNYHEMRAQRVAIGDNYIFGDQYCWAPEACITTIAPDADLVVEGNVGVGTVTPLEKLHVANANIRLSRPADRSLTTTLNYSNDGGLQWRMGMLSNSMDSFSIERVGYAPPKNKVFSIDEALNTTLYGGHIEVYGDPVINGDGRYIMNLDDNTPFALGVGGGISFGGHFDNGSGIADFGSIKGIKETANISDAAGALVFIARPNNGFPTEWMRIRGTNGNVGIGTPTPVTKLHVQGAITYTPQAQPSNSESTEGTLYYDSSTHKYRYRDNTGWKDFGGGGALCSTNFGGRTTINFPLWIRCYPTSNPRPQSILQLSNAYTDVGGGVNYAGSGLLFTYSVDDGSFIGGGSGYNCNVNIQQINETSCGGG